LVWWTTYYTRRLRPFSSFIVAIWSPVQLIIHVIDSQVDPSSSFHSKTSFQDPLIILTLWYCMFLFNLSYCKFKFIVLLVSPSYLSVCLVSELTQQNSLSIEALAALPPHLKFLLAPSLNKTLARVISLIVAGVIAKYHH
jgi:hypothetical protein